MKPSEFLHRSSAPVLPPEHKVLSAEGTNPAIHVPFAPDLPLNRREALARQKQRQVVLEYLQRTLWISKEYAAAQLGIMHLRARVVELRNEGFDIVEGRMLDAGMTRWVTVYGLRLPIPKLYLSYLQERGFGTDMLEVFFSMLGDAGLVTMPVESLPPAQLLSAAIFLIQMQITNHD